MARPIVTADQQYASMCVYRLADMLGGFRQLYNVEPATWSPPSTMWAGVHVIFGRVNVPHIRAGMLAIWMIATYGDDGDPFISCFIDTVEDLQLITWDVMWRRDDRELFGQFLGIGLKQALFADS